MRWNIFERRHILMSKTLFLERAFVYENFIFCSMFVWDDLELAGHKPFT